MLLALDAEEPRVDAVADALVVPLPEDEAVLPNVLEDEDDPPPPSGVSTLRPVQPTESMMPITPKARSRCMEVP
jgi:hypothetical protein